jgi:hypothetical protein
VGKSHKFTSKKWGYDPEKLEKHLQMLVRLSELPLAIRIAHSDALSFFHMLVLDGGEEAVQEAGGEEA